MTRGKEGDEEDAEEATGVFRSIRGCHESLRVGYEVGGTKVMRTSVVHLPDPEPE